MKNLTGHLFHRLSTHPNYELLWELTGDSEPDSIIKPICDAIELANPGRTFEVTGIQPINDKYEGGFTIFTKDNLNPYCDKITQGRLCELNTSLGRYTYDNEEVDLDQDQETSLTIEFKELPHNQADLFFQEDYKIRYRYRKELGLLISPQYVYLYALLLDAEDTLNQIEQRSGEILHQMAIQSGIIYPAKPDNC